MDYSKASLELHGKFGGKISTELKVPLENKDDLSLAYTPGVGAVSLAVAEDEALALSHTIKDNTIAVVSDGSAVLGLGNLGPLGALPVMEGKCALFKKFGNVNAFPICLDTQDPEEIIHIVKNIAPVFGGINLEDIAAPNCFYVEEQLKSILDIPVLHDDQHGTAVVVLAAITNALKLAEKKLGEVKIVINGAGAAGVAIAKLLKFAGATNILVCDSIGILHEGRHSLNSTKLELLSITNPGNVKGLLMEALAGADVFIGVSKGGLLGREHISNMNKGAIIFALANPVPEIFPEEAKLAGAFIYASGRSDFPNQINNVLAFPGLFKGALKNKVKTFTKDHLIATAKVIASSATNPTPEFITPSPFTENLADQIAEVIV